LFVLLRARELWCAVPLASVVETMRPLPVEPIAEQPPFMLGMSVARGALVPVVDLRRLVGAPPASAPERFVTLRVDDRVCAVAVDEVAGVRRLGPEVLAGLPPLLRDAGEAFVEALGVLDRRLLMVLRAGRIVPPEVWASAELA
jgi:purine-binding chemotaxis protein CheW